MSSLETGHLLRPTWMEIDLSRLAHNVSEVRRVVGAHRRLTVAAKADAYGHGLTEVVPTLVDAGADVIAVGNMNDAVRLRKAGHEGPLLLFGSALADIAATVVEHGVMPTVWDVEGARAYSAAACQPLNVCLEIDSGFHRLGVLPEMAAAVARQIEDLPNLHIDYVYTHFADPEDEGFAREQYRRFVEAVESIRAAGVDVRCSAAASSTVVSTYSDMYLSGVDVGHLVYGFYLPPGPTVPVQLRTVAKALKSRIIQVKWVEAGERIGAVWPFHARQRTLVGTLPIGYSDGLMLTNAPRASVLVRGKRCPLLGAVCLEHCAIDLTETGGAGVGDEAVFFGEQAGASITLAEHAKWAGMSEMQVLVQLGRSVPRVYLS